MFTELQAFWTHGKRPFDENDEGCLEVLKIMHERSLENESYIVAVNTWVFSDVKKRTIAKQNNLKYLEIFDYSNFDKILQDIQCFALS